MSTLRTISWLGAAIRTATFAAVIAAAAPVAHAASETIEFPDNELSSESVLPVFDHPEGVKQRLVPTARRIELGLTGSYSLTEPFANPLSFGVIGSYHLNETHALNLLGLSFMSGVSNYAEQLNEVKGSVNAANLQYAPMPKYLFLASYQYTGYYGKISLSKDTVMNLSLYGLLGVGMVGIGDSSNPALSLGIGQKFYLSSKFAFRFDLRALAYQGPDVVSISLSNRTSEAPSADFEKKLLFGSLISASLIYLFPSF
ncbi:MAG: outer membrane beta-barrel domain-containing protein [Proteobacteria bacterium]|nr:MAG: outer membrane beta-barrel domain-containing protein [Pseudomonadota bacterium]